MNSRVTSKRINQNERLTRRANNVSNFMKYLGWVLTLVALSLLWQLAVEFFKLNMSGDSLFRLIKTMADAFALPFRGLIPRVPALGSSPEALYLVAFASYTLGYLLVGQLLKAFVRVPGA